MDTKSPEPLWTRGFGVLLASTVLGWGAEGMIQATLPLLILDLGGDAATVGFVAASFAIPTLLLRPAIGRRIDRTGHGGLHQLGATIAMMAALGYAVASLVLIAPVRFLQGIGWALFGTSNNVVTARLAPAARRGEASGLFNVAYATGFLLGPPIGLYLYANAWDRAPFLAASFLCLVTLGAVTVLRRLAPGPPPRREDAGAPLALTGPGEAPPAGLSAAGEAGGRIRPSGRARRAIESYLEPAAIPMLAITATFMAGQVLFLGFAPVYARAIGAPLEWLAAYYPMYGVLNAGSQLVTGRVSDRFGRLATVVAGSVLGGIGLALPLVPVGFASFAAGAACFALAVGIVTPATTAATMDRAPEGRLGSSMATFSMAYQLAAGGGGAAWGLVITGVGYPWPFALGIGLQVVTVILAVRHLPGRGSR